MALSIASVMGLKIMGYFVVEQISLVIPGATNSFSALEKKIMNRQTDVEVTHDRYVPWLL